MRKKKGILPGGLQRKTVILVLALLFATIGVFVGVSAYQSRVLTGIVEQTKEQQQRTISQVSRDTMHGVLSQTLVNIASLRANVANTDFSEVINDIHMLRTLAEETFEDRSSPEPGELRLPDPSMDGTVSAMVLCEAGVDWKSSEYLGIAARLSGAMIAMTANSPKIDGCYIGLVDGTDLCVDDKALTKFDADGRLIPFPVRQRPWYTGAAEAGGLYFTGIEEDAFSGRLLVTCSTPVMAGGELVGVVGIDIILGSMRDFMSAGAENGGTVLVVNERGEVILSSAEEGLFSAKRAGSGGLRELGNEALKCFVENALSEKTELTELTLDGREYYAAGASMPAVGWAVISIVDRETTEQPEKRMLVEFDRISSTASAQFWEKSARIDQTVLVILAAVILVSVTAALLAAGRIAKPLEEMTQNIVESNSTGAFFEMKADYKTHDEIELLAEAFDDLSKKSRQYIEDLTQITKEKERVNTELNMASRIQSSMLPHVFPPFPDRQEFDIYASMDPAKEVGGDFYDFFLIDNDHLCLVIADVSGKGIPAALFMMISKVILQSCAMLGKSAAEILSLTNAAICSRNEVEMFVTVWLGILEISSGTLTAANAGHEYPALLRAGGQFELFKDRHGFVIGGMEGMKYREYQLSLAPGDKLFLYTDGVPEATDAHNALFGTDRMLQALNADTGLAPEGVLKAVRHAVDVFVGDAEQFDDLTMLCLQYNGPGGAASCASPADQKTEE